MRSGRPRRPNSQTCSLDSRRILPSPPLDHADRELLWTAEEVAAILAQLASDPEIRPAFERRLAEYVGEIRHLASLLLRREHKVAFIGSIGIGKSTAICRATGMEVAGQQGRPVPVLETGGGGVTLCEVHLSVGPGYGVIVEPRSSEEIRADVADFADQLTRGGDQTEEETQRGGHNPRCSAGDRTRTAQHERAQAEANEGRRRQNDPVGSRTGSRNDDSFGTRVGSRDPREDGATSTRSSRRVVRLLLADGPPRLDAAHVRGDQQRPSP